MEDERETFYIKNKKFQTGSLIVTDSIWRITVDASKSLHLESLIYKPNQTGGKAAGHLTDFPMVYQRPLDLCNSLAISLRNAALRQPLHTMIFVLKATIDLKVHIDPISRSGRTGHHLLHLIPLILPSESRSTSTTHLTLARADRTVFY
ncbi:hypothetical protein PROFUN_06133 [Planoprotostelium fungivorum]|uniref:Uncharacterized protein n=1 Tax=Planoprotostelium fungivorum TaxID=1890364 RepID=A0A2P6NPH7_9EUKA|nr:hypothetical protein PROFUN_06133 [Planoprotostelium fungivorum]